MTDPINEADLLEQRTGVRPEEQDVPEPPEVGEADPADVHEQRLAVPDEDERRDED